MFQHIILFLFVVQTVGQSYQWVSAGSQMMRVRHSSCSSTLEATLTCNSESEGMFFMHVANRYGGPNGREVAYIVSTNALAQGWGLSLSLDSSQLTLTGGKTCSSDNWEPDTMAHLYQCTAPVRSFIGYQWVTSFTDRIYFIVGDCTTSFSANFICNATTLNMAIIDYTGTPVIVETDYTPFQADGSGAVGIGTSTLTVTQNTDCTNNGIVNNNATLIRCVGIDPAGGGAGDPIIYGFDGGWFEFMGEADKVFNLISDYHFQLNSRFIHDESVPAKMTWIGDIGIMVGRDKFAYFLNGTKTLNGVDIQPSIEILGDGGKITIWKEAVAFEIPNYQLYFTVLPNPPHFNVHADYIAGPNSNPHGVIGQTSDGVMRLQSPGDAHILRTYMDDGFRICTGMYGAGCIDGQSEDYQIQSDDVFGTDFLFNRFEGGHIPYTPKQPFLPYKHVKPHVFDKQPPQGFGIIGGTGEGPREELL